MASHGMSVVEIERGRDHRARGSACDHRKAPATTAGSPPARRSASTAPPPGDHRLRTTADPTGTTRPRHARTTAPAAPRPWGTVLTGEENFNQYFDASGDARRRATPTSYARYGITGDRQPRLERGRPPLRPDHGAARAVPVRLDRRGRPLRPDVDAAQAHDARPVQARGRQRRHRPTTASAVGLHGRRRARRLHLQVRLPRQVSTAAARQRRPPPQPDPAGRTAPSTSPRFTGDGRERRPSTTAPASGSR